MQLRQIMTSSVVTAGLDADVFKVAQLMRDHNVGSIVLCDPEGEPAAMITDRDLAIQPWPRTAPARSPPASTRPDRWSPGSPTWTSRRPRP